jgi:hypothetical protein
MAKYQPMRMPRLCIPQPESSPIDTTKEQMQAIGARDRIESRFIHADSCPDHRCHREPFVCALNSGVAVKFGRRRHPI